MKKYIFPMILLTAGLAGCPNKDTINEKYFESPKNPLTEIYPKYPGLEQELEKQMYALDLKIMNRLGVEIDSLYNKGSDMEYTTAVVDMISKDLKTIESRTDSLFHFSPNDKKYLERCLGQDYLDKFGEFIQLGE